MRASSIPFRLRVWDRIAIYLALGSITLLAWWYLIAMAADMAAMDMPQQMPPSTAAWTLRNTIMMFLMWSIMMVGMMLPSAIRTLMIYARIVRQTGLSPLLATLLFLAGYLLMWTVFSLFATLLQGLFNQQMLVSDSMVSTSNALTATLFMVAGIYQLTPLKQSCLKHCQSPVAYLSQHFRRGYTGALRMGLHHGLYCLGCCWLLMGLLFVAGVMNLLWILALTLFVLIEKLLPSNPYTRLLPAVLMLLCGFYFLINAL
jgi:predicted metal-binding membrane protein